MSRTKIHIHAVKQAVSLAAAGTGLLLLAGCHQDMWNQPKLSPYHQSVFFTNGSSDRPPVPHTVDQAHFWTDEGRYTGYVGTRIVNGKLIPGRMVTRFPFTITPADLKRGRSRFNIFCSPCHGVLGNGEGEIAMRGLALRRQPADYSTARLRKMPIGHFYDVITNGYGVMYSYASRITPDDRWRIAAWIRVLQRAADAKPSDIPDSYPQKASLLQQISAQGAPQQNGTTNTTKNGSGNNGQ